MLEDKFLTVVQSGVTSQSRSNNTPGTSQEEYPFDNQVFVCITNIKFPNILPPQRKRFEKEKQ